MEKSITRTQKITLISIMAVFVIIYTGIVCLNHYYFRSYCFDFGFFNYNFYQFAHFNYAPQILYDPPIQGYFSNHLAFIFLFVSILYWPLEWIFGTYTLLIIQVVIMTIGSFYTYKLVKYKSNNTWHAIIFMYLSFIILGKFSALSFDYMDTTVGASLLPIFLYFIERKKYLISFIFLLLILGTKENMALMMSFLLITLLIHNRKDYHFRKVGSGMLFFSVLYFVLSFTVIIPAFEDPHHKYFGFLFSALGETPFEALGFIIKHPFQTFMLMFENHMGNPVYDNIKAEMYWFVLISGGLILFRNPLWILPFIPLIGQKVFNDMYVRWGLNAFYMIEIVTLLPIAIYYSFNKFKSSKLKNGILIALVISTSLITLVKLNSRTSKWYIREKENFLNSKLYTEQFDVKKVHSFLDKLPKDAKVSASNTIVPHVAFRDNIYVYPYVRDAEYIVLIKDFMVYPIKKEEMETKIQELKENPEWDIQVDDYPLIVFKRAQVQISYLQ